jgi:hypothetical protein
VAIYYFTKWYEAMPTFSNDSEMDALLIFNQVIARFDVPRDIIIDHGSHFHNIPKVYYPYVIMYKSFCSTISSHINHYYIFIIL